MSDDPVRWRADQDSCRSGEERDRYRSSSGEFRLGGSEYDPYGRDYEGNYGREGFPRRGREEFSRGAASTSTPSRTDSTATTATSKG